MALWDIEEVYVLQDMGYLKKDLKIPADDAPEHERALFVIHIRAAQHVFAKDHPDTPQPEYP